MKRLTSYNSLTGVKLGYRDEAGIIEEVAIDNVAIFACGTKINATIAVGLDTNFSQGRFVTARNDV